MSATVRSDSYLTLHYRITTLDGEEFLSTFDMSPATLQMGSGQLAENLESVLIGLPAHERFVFELEDVHMNIEARLIERIARSGLPAEMELKENSVVEFTAPNGGTFAGFLRELDATHALFDFNHPMAGKTIRFEVEIIGIM